MQERTWAYFINRRERLTQGRLRVGMMWLCLWLVFTSVVAGIVDVLWGLEFKFLFGIATLALALQWAFANLALP